MTRRETRDARREPTSTSDRILAAAAEAIAAEGVSEVSMMDVARRAGVSKALILYHFADREALLARLVDALADAIVAREGEALLDAPSSAAVERLWSWLEGELLRGELRALCDLATLPHVHVRARWAESARRRRLQATRTAERLFAVLGLRPRVPASMMAEVMVAFVDGLAIAPEPEDVAERRIAFDVFWLAMLSLAE